MVNREVTRGKADFDQVAPAKLASPQRQDRPWRRAFYTGLASFSFLCYTLLNLPTEERAAFFDRMFGPTARLAIWNSVSRLATDPVGIITREVSEQIENGGTLAKTVSLFILFKMLALFFRKRVERRNAELERAQADPPSRAKRRAEHRREAKELKAS